MKKKKIFATLLIATQLITTVPSNLVIASAEETNNEQSQVVSSNEENPYLEFQCMDELTQEDLKKAEENSMSLEELEYYTGKNQPQSASDMQAAEASLPSSVDLYGSKYLPAGVRQKGGTCWAYSSVYYQASYEYNKANDIEATSSNSLSPLFVHNLYNSKPSSGGSNAVSAYNVLSTIGSPSLGTYEQYLSKNNNFSYVNWAPDIDVWKDAIKHRCIGYYRETVSDNITGEELTRLKSVLNDGSVLSFGNEVYWLLEDENCVTLQNSNKPNVTNSKHTGDLLSYAARGHQVYNEKSGEYQDSDPGYHQMTIIGYDDNIWVDINNNEQVEDDEKGAFKVLNSWGDLHNDKPYFWISYDAFRLESKVLPKLDHFTNSRAACFGDLYRLVYSKNARKNDAYLKLTINTERRNDLDITIKCDGLSYKFRDGYQEDTWMKVKYKENGEEKQREEFFDKNYNFSGINNQASSGTIILPLDNIYLQSSHLTLSKKLTVQDIYNKDWKIIIKDNNKNDFPIKIEDIQFIDEYTYLNCKNFVEDDPYNNINVSSSNPIILDGQTTTLKPVTRVNVKSHTFNKSSGVVGSPVNLSVDLDSKPLDTNCKFMAQGGNYQYGSKEKYFTKTSLTSGTWTPDMDGTYNIFVDTTTNGKTNRFLLCSYLVKKEEATKVTVYYKGVPNAHIHYQIGNGSWTSVPGYSMENNSDVTGCEYKYTVDLGDETKLNACFNNGANVWDNNGSNNYSFEAGKYYSVIGGKVTEIEKPVQQLEVTSLTSNYPKGVTSYRTVQLTASAKNITGTAKYTFIDIDVNGIQKTIVSNASSNKISWTPSSYGKHKIKVIVSDDKGSAERLMELPVNNYIKASFSGATELYVGDTSQYKITATGGTGNYKYTFYTYKNGDFWNKIILQEGSSNTLNWTAKDLGSQLIYFAISDEGGYSTEIGYMTVNVKNKPLEVKLVTIDNKTVTSGGEISVDYGKPLSVKVNAVGGSGTYTYNVYAAFSAHSSEQLVYGSNSTGTWTPKFDENYSVIACVNDSNGGYTNIQFSVKVNKVEENKAVIYYKSSFGSAYIHYQVGNGSWTSVPGKAMTYCTDVEGCNYKAEINLGDETSLTGCFNNGNGSWDSNGGSNYNFGKGYYTCLNGVVTKISEPKPSELKISSVNGENVNIDETNKVITFYYNTEGKIKVNPVGGSGSYTYDLALTYTTHGIAVISVVQSTTNEIKYTPKVTSTNPATATLIVKDSNGNSVTKTYSLKFEEKKTNTMTIYYKAAKATNIHYKIGNGSWTSAPGVAMEVASDKSGYYKKVIELGDNSNITACFNDGSNWDNNNGNNYYFGSAGVYTCSDGNIIKIQ